MDHSQFLQSLVDASLLDEHSHCFTDEVIKRWLEDNQWIEDAASPCKWCEHLTDCGHGFTEERCRLNVAAGYSCYRQTLAKVFAPFLRNALQGKYPPVDDLRNVIHRMGPNRDGMGNETIVGIILHELGSTFIRMDD